MSKLLSSSKKSLKTFIILSRAFRSVFDVSTKDIESYNMNTTEFAVLELVYHKGPQPLQHIGEKILIASGSITYVVDKLEKKGLLKRVPSPSDRRVIYATITPDGEEFMKENFPQHEKVLHNYIDVLSDDEKEQLMGLLKKLSRVEKKGE